MKPNIEIATFLGMWFLGIWMSGVMWIPLYQTPPKSLVAQLLPPRVYNWDSRVQNPYPPTIK